MSEQDRIKNENVIDDIGDEFAKGWKKMFGRKPPKPKWTGPYTTKRMAQWKTDPTDGKKRVPKTKQVIPLSEARRIHKSRKRHVKKADECQNNREQLVRPTVAWAENPGQFDVPGIDAPGQCLKRKKTGTEACYQRKDQAVPKKCKGTKWGLG